MKQHIKLIATHIIKHWLRGNDDPEMAKIAKTLTDDVYDMWRKCVEEEKAWARHLMKNGFIIGS